MPTPTPSQTEPIEKEADANVWDRPSVGDATRRTAVEAATRNCAVRFTMSLRGRGLHRNHAGDVPGQKGPDWAPSGPSGPATVPPATPAPVPRRGHAAGAGSAAAPPESATRRSSAASRGSAPHPPIHHHEGQDDQEGEQDHQEHGEQGRTLSVSLAGGALGGPRGGVGMGLGSHPPAYPPTARTFIPAHGGLAEQTRYRQG